MIVANGTLVEFKQFVCSVGRSNRSYQNYFEVLIATQLFVIISPVALSSPPSVKKVTGFTLSGEVTLRGSGDPDPPNQLRAC